MEARGNAIVRGVEQSGKAVWRLIKGAVALALFAAAIYWLRLSPVPIKQHHVERGEIAATVMGTGTLEAQIKTTISPKISGRLERVQVDQGDRVTAGQVLAHLDNSDLSQQVAIAEAGIAAAHAAVDLVEADSVRAKAILDQAKRDHQRFTNLTSAQVATSVEFEKASEALAVAEAGFSKSRAAITEARKQVITAEKTLEYHRARLADTLLTAPFDGLIVRRHRDPGDVVVPGGGVLSLISTEVMWISAWVDETQMAQVSPGQPAKIVFRSEPEKSYEGAVSRMGRETDRETREFIVDVRVAELPPNWAVGQRAEVYIETGRKADCVILPSEWVNWKEGQPGTFLKVAGKARWRPLGVGLRGGDAVEITEGLTAGDIVIKPVSLVASELSEGRMVVTP
ncbi:MAG: efflux RND transporter periplasmic adaptor subunit [Candidatus Omnitrophica bacterium]|nr:efflux RND transporter periplasmic adaptor subunit [Candidatus Omnitrophota bacterium]